MAASAHPQDPELQVLEYPFASSDSGESELYLSVFFEGIPFVVASQSDQKENPPFNLWATLF